MKERPIIFSSKMVKAILEGRKTQTRRVVKNKEDTMDDSPLTKYEYHGILKDSIHVMARLFRGTCVEFFHIKCPYGEVGDKLWVRETWANFKGDIFYKEEGSNNHRIEEATGWKPSIFMPRKYSRITLEITDVRVEKLHDIVAEDCIREGCNIITLEAICHQGSSLSALNWFENLWNSIHKKEHTWEDNPWVWVISFKKITTYPKIQ